VAEKKVWLITSAGRGMGVDIAQAALAAGHAIVATGRNPERVTEAVGESEDLLAVKLDVTDPADAQAAVRAAVDRFGRIDVLVNNAGNFYAGFFEEISAGDFRGNRGSGDQRGHQEPARHLPRVGDAGAIAGDREQVRDPDQLAAVIRGATESSSATLVPIVQNRGSAAESSSSDSAGVD
jgi:NAD(P)-dependent dehydrogenase (short-subunit alcohol dehydrogenase family)